jgi:hypothetical protein
LPVRLGTTYRHGAETGTVEERKPTGDADERVAGSDRRVTIRIAGSGRGGRAMGRGRAKAKQTRVARQLKYNSGGTDLDALRKEIVGEVDDDEAEDGYAEEYEEDLYSRYADMAGRDDEDERASG